MTKTTTYYELDWYGRSRSTEYSDLYGTEPDHCMLVVEDEDGNAAEWTTNQRLDWADTLAVDWSSDKELDGSVNFTARVRVAGAEVTR